MFRQTGEASVTGRIDSLETCSTAVDFGVLPARERRMEWLLAKGSDSQKLKALTQLAEMAPCLENLPLGIRKIIRNSQHPLCQEALKVVKGMGPRASEAERDLLHAISRNWRFRSLDVRIGRGGFSKSGNLGCSLDLGRWGITTCDENPARGPGACGYTTVRMKMAWIRDRLVLRPASEIEEAYRRTLFSIYPPEQKYVPQLIRLLSSKSNWVRKTAAFRLGEIGAKEAIPALVKLRRTKDPDGELANRECSGSANWSFARIIPDAGIPEVLKMIGAPRREQCAELVGLLRSIRGEVRAEAFMQLRFAGCEAREALESEIRRKDIRTLRKCKALLREM